MKKIISLVFIMCIVLCSCQNVDTGYVHDQDKEDINKIETMLETTEEIASVYSSVSTTSRSISIIFEGYDTQDHMNEIIDLIKELRLNTVLFVPGAKLYENTELIQDINHAGIRVGNYGLSGEKGMDKLKSDKMVRQIYRTQRLITTTIGQAPVYFRANGNEYTSDMLKVASLCGVKAAVLPTSYINFRSFKEADNATNYVRSLARGSVISIKIGQELDNIEYTPKNSEEFNQEDPQESIADQEVETGEEILSDHEQLLNNIRWLSEALKEEKIDVLSLEGLQSVRETLDTEKVELSSDILESLSISNYPNFTTEEPFGVQEGATVDPSFFEDAVFIGDSISAKLKEYAAKTKGRDQSIADATFLTAVSLSVGNSLWNISDESKHPIYQGKKRTIEESVELSKAKNIFIMLGMNDISFYSKEEYIENLKTLISLIKERHPESKFYIQSITPKTKEAVDGPSLEAIFEYNLALVQLSYEYGYSFIDVAYALRDEYGYLPEDYCSDAKEMGMHFTDKACKIWVDYLYTHIIN